MVAESPEEAQKDLWMNPDRLGTAQDSQYVTALSQLQAAIAATAAPAITQSHSTGLPHLW